MDFVLDGCPLRRHFGCPMPENLFWAVSWCLQGNWGKAMDAATRERQLSVSKRRRWRREAATFDAHKRRRVELNGRGRCRLPRSQSLPIIFFHYTLLRTRRLEEQGLFLFQSCPALLVVKRWSSSRVVFTFVRPFLHVVLRPDHPTDKQRPLETKLFRVLFLLLRRSRASASSSMRAPWPRSRRCTPIKRN